MNRSIRAWGATVLAVAAIVGYQTLPSSQKEAHTEASAPAKTSESLTASKQEPILACVEITRAITDFIPTTHLMLPASCSPESGKRIAPFAGYATSKQDVRYIIATLPDPVHTHFPLLFDRLTEAVQQGAQDQGYNYDESWLPWNDEPRTYSSLNDQLDANRLLRQQEEQPGVLVFRKAISSSSDEKSVPYQKGLMVFVVGENPTGGINLAQFRNAVCWVQGLEEQVPRKESTKPRLGILGPYFSGSLPSLAQALTTNSLSSSPMAASCDSGPSGQPTGQKGTAKAADVPLEIFSGSVSSRAGIDWFNRFLADRQAFFYSFQENDDVMIDRYCRYLSKLGYDTGKVAILSEDETAYGEQAAAQQSSKMSEQFPSCADPWNSAAHGPLYLYYPRDIAALRSAYESEAPRSLGLTQNQTGNNGLGLPLNLSEPRNRQHDTIRTYGQGETPLSQEATLLGLINLFSAHDIHFIILRSSNTLDQVFLTQFFSKAFPDARIVLTSSDLLFRRGSETAGFRGTTTLTTYPLFTWQQDWTHWQSPESRHSHRAFAEGTAEGLYLATRFLIDGEFYSDSDQCVPQQCSNQHPPCLRLQNSSVAIQDYAPPLWLLPPVTSAILGPPTWLSVIGNQQFWPVGVLDDGLYGNKALQCGVTGTPCSTLPKVWLPLPKQRKVELPLPLSMKVLLFLSSLWAVWHLLGCYLGSKRPCQALLGSVHYPGNFAAMREQKRRQISLILISGLVVITSAVLVASLTGLFSFDRTCEGKILLAISCAVLALCPAVGFFFICKSRQTPEAGPSYLTRHVAWFLTTAIVSGFIAYLMIRISLTHYNDIPAYWRSLNPLSGVAPVVPMILLMVGLYGWCWFSLNGLALFNGDRPQLPRYPEPPRRQTSGPISSGIEIGRKIELTAMPLGPRYGRKLLGVLLGLILCKILVFTGPLNDRLSPKAWLQTFSVRSLGSRWYGLLFFAYLALCVGLILLDGWQILFTWWRLRKLLRALDQLPLRRTLVRMKGFSWGTVWRMSGDVLDQRNRLISRQLESLTHLMNHLAHPLAGTSASFPHVHQLEKNLRSCQSLIEEYSGLSTKLEREAGAKRVSTIAETHAITLSRLQRKLAATATLVLDKFLLERWHQEKDSLMQSDATPEGSGESLAEKEGCAAPVPELVSAAEEFFALPCLGFIQNVLGRIRSMVLGTTFLFVAAALSVASYPFDPRPELGAIFLTVFVVIAAIILFVYVQMHRDATLSHITNTNPGELGYEFWLKIIGVGAGPVLALLATLFPQITTFVASWLQPGVQTMK